MARIINSPGVQITEKDLSLRVQSPVGTNVVVPGFADQGPTSEPLLITSMSEFESIYGYPTTPAEKYFYYSCREILNSPAVLTTIRLPYGLSGGSDFSNSYSGLFYPMVSSSDNPSVSATWAIGEPIHINLKQTEYDKIKTGNFDWGVTSISGAATVDNITADIEVNAGFIILNDLQTVITDVGEGYYVGFADNLSVSIDSLNFDSIKTLTTLSANGAYTSLETNRLDFVLSATKVDSDRGVVSISENLEKVGFVGYETPNYQDHLSLGVFKVRRSTVDATKLTLATTEKYLGSLDSNRKQASPSGGILVNSFIETIINNNSPTINIAFNPAISQTFNWNNGTTTPVSKVVVSNSAKKLFPVGVYSSSVTNASDKVIGYVPLKLEKVLRTLENPENAIVDVIVDAGLSTIYSTTEYAAANAYADDTFITGGISSVIDDWKTVVDTLIRFSESTRKDCFTIIDPHRSVFVSGKDTKVIDVDGNSFTINIYNPLRSLLETLETNYASTYANWIKITDIFTSKRIWLPFSGYAAAIFGRSDAAANTWAAPAGMNRGTFSNVLDIGFNPNQKQRDRLYEIPANPVVLFSGDGYSVMGQKTLQNKPTAFDRINVRRLFLTLERAVQRTLKYFVFEPNTDFTRNRLKAVVSPIFEFAKDTEGVYDYLIVCDERNNTPDTIDNNELIVDIYLKPVRTAEFILVNFIATRTGQNFQELI